MSFKSNYVSGTGLDKIGANWWIFRKRFKTIPLLLGWKLVKEECDEEFRNRLIKVITNHGVNY